MNQRLLARQIPPAGAPARAALVEALAVVLPETAAELDARLDAETPWLVDLPSPEEAERLRAWIEATSPVRVGVAPAFGEKAPSRAAAIAWLEQKLAEERSKVAAAAEETQRQREEAARDRARALAAEKKPPVGAPPRARSSISDPDLVRHDTPWRTFRRVDTTPGVVLPPPAPPPPDRRRLALLVALVAAALAGVAYLALGA